MADLSASAANIRLSGKYEFQAYCTVPSEPVIFRALVNQSTFTYPLKTLTFDTVTVGAFTDILEDQELVIYSGNTTTVKGRLRVASGVATSTVLQVEEFSQGRISVADNDKIEVLRSWRPHMKMVAANANFDKDSRLVYGSQGSNQPPISCSGGHWVGFVDDGQVFATVVFTGSGSFTVDSDTGGTMAHLWTVGDGTITVGTSTSASITATFPVGERWISHRVTDNGNSVATTQYVYVRVFDHVSNRPDDCMIEDMQMSDGGWGSRIVFPAGRTQAQLADGSMAIIWEREYRNGSVLSYGSNATGRSHIKMVGVVVNDSITEDKDSGEVSFEVVNPVALLDQIPGWSQILRRRASPTKWRQQKGLTTNRALIYMLRWHSSILTTCDLVLSADNHNFPVFYIEASALGDQMRELVAGVDGVWSCDRAGRICIQQDLQLSSTSERTAATTTWTFTADDIQEINLERKHRWEYGQLEFRMFTAATTVATSRPKIALAPGSAIGEAVGKATVEKGIGVDITDGKERAAHRFAYLNATYNGLPTSRGTITLPDSFDVFDVYQEWVKLTLASGYNQRGITFSSTRFVIKSISIDYDNDAGTKQVRLTIEEECEGSGAIAKKVKTPAENNVPAFTPPRIEMPYYPPITPVGDTVTAANAALFADNNTVQITSTWLDDDPTWTSNALSLNGSMLKFVADPHSPGLTTGVGAVNGWILTSTRVYKIADIYGARTLTSVLTFTGGANTLRNMEATALVSGWVMVASNRLASGGTVIDYSLDGGTTWQPTVTVTAFYNTTNGVLLRGNEAFPGLSLSMQPGREGYAYVGAYTVTAGGQSATSAIYETPDYGATWNLTTKANNAQWSFRGLHVPTHNNLDDEEFYYCFVDTSSTIVQRRRNKDGTVTTIDPITGSGKGAGAERQGVMTHPLDSNRLVVIAKQPSGSTYLHTPFASSDKGATWRALDTVQDVTTGSAWFTVYFDGYDRDTIYLLGSAGTIAACYNTFSTVPILVSKLGNMTAGLDFKGMVRK